MSNRPTNEGPLSRPIESHSVPEGGLELAIEASPDERAAVAREFGLVGVGSLKADFTIERRAGGRLAVHGDLQAAFTQVCVVSLEPFDSRIQRPIDLTFAPPADAVEAPPIPPRSRRREAPARDRQPPRPVTVPGNDDQEDPPDPIVDGRIDLGAIALEFLTLSLDLYPRKPGVHFADVSIGDKDEATDTPFSALQRLKDRS